MSCEECERLQEELIITAPDDVDHGFYSFVRIGRANVLICGCPEHMKELLRLVRRDDPLPIDPLAR